MREPARYDGKLMPSASCPLRPLPLGFLLPLLHVPEIRVPRSSTLLVGHLLVTIRPSSIRTCKERPNPTVRPRAQLQETGGVLGRSQVLSGTPCGPRRQA